MGILDFASGADIFGNLVKAGTSIWSLYQNQRNKEKTWDCEDNAV